MLCQKLCYRIGSWAFILLGVGHLFTQWFAPKTADYEILFNVMRNFAINMLASQGNLYKYHVGFSLTMGMLLIAYGIQSLLAVSFGGQTPEVERRLFVLHTLVSALMVVMAIKYFFLIPIVFMSVAFLSFGLGLLLGCGAHCQGCETGKGKTRC